jgi:hypothetical protein
MLSSCFEQKLDPTRNTSPHNVLRGKISRCHEIPYFNGILRLKSWDFASMLGFVDMSGA